MIARSVCVVVADWIPQKANSDLKIKFIMEYSWDKHCGREYAEMGLGRGRS